MYDRVIAEPAVTAPARFHNSGTDIRGVLVLFYARNYNVVHINAD